MSLRGQYVDLFGTETLFTETCYSCGVLFAMTNHFQKTRRENHREFYCPNGHGQHYSDKTPATKAKEAEARAVHLEDQLKAAIRDAEGSRQTIVRDRERFLNGVCPCCTRTFENVRRHMVSQHPEYDLAQVGDRITPQVECSCSEKFETFRGLRTHQGHQRRETGTWQWDKPGQSSYYAHLTVVG